MDLKQISYNDIINLFDSEWDFSYLYYEEMEEVLNFPIKMAPNHLERLVEWNNDIPKDAIFLVIVKHTEDYDYSLNHTFEIKCRDNLPIELTNFWCNYKYAAVKAGMGQYAKNSLFFHNKFHFETHLSVFIIFNKIVNLPTRNMSNFSLLAQCNNCNDCYNVCPVNAIHNQSKPYWIDMNKCDNFCFFGNHPRIPTIKYNHKLLSHLTTEEKFNIQNYEDFHKLYPNITLNSSYIKNGQLTYYQYPTCRECTSQPKCSKYGGNYPYNWQNVKKIIGGTTLVEI